MSYDGVVDADEGAPSDPDAGSVVVLGARADPVDVPVCELRVVLHHGRELHHQLVVTHVTSHKTRVVHYAKVKNNTVVLKTNKHEWVTRNYRLNIECLNQPRIIL